MEDDYVRKCMIMGFIFSYLTIDLLITIEIFKYYSEFIYGRYREITYLQFDYAAIMSVKMLLLIKSSILLLFILVIAVRLMGD